MPSFHFLPEPAATAFVVATRSAPCWDRPSAIGSEAWPSGQAASFPISHQYHINQCQSVNQSQDAGGCWRTAGSVVGSFHIRPYVNVLH